MVSKGLEKLVIRNTKGVLRGMTTSFQFKFKGSSQNLPFNVD